MLCGDAGHPPTTTTDGHWFALPNIACPTQNDLPAYYNAVYNVTGTVNFKDGATVKHTATLTVDAYWNPSGYVDPNIARITGVPNMAADKNGVWHVTGMGTLARFVPTQAVINVISTSQFYNKAVQHEQVHLNQWILGPGHLFGDLYIPSAFYSQIQNVTGTSQNDLITKLGNSLTTYVNSQAAMANQRLSQSEHEAYLVSDPIAPQYVYQNCGRY